jgi:hypothetical protein
MGLKRREGFSCLLLPPPAFRECGHSSFARRSVAVRRRAVLMVPEGQRPRPRRSDRRGIGLEDAADDGAIREHVKSRRHSTGRTTYLRKALASSSASKF